MDLTPGPVVPKLIPVNTAAPVVSGTATEGETLTVSDGEWTNDPTSHTYAWQHDNAGDGNYHTIAGATGNTYVLTDHAVGSRMRAGVIATNADGSSDIVYSAPTAIVEALPVEPAEPAVAPVLTQTSADGENPLAWSTQFTDLIVDADDYVEMRHRVDGGAWVTEDPVLVTSDWVMDYIIDGNPRPRPLYDAATFAGGVTLEVQEGVTRGEDATVWSDSLIDVMAAVVEAASSWATATGPNKSQYVTVGGAGNLTATGQSGFNDAPTSVRATQARNGKRQFQVVTNGAAKFSRLFIGVDNGTDNLADQGVTNFSLPGKSNASGVALEIRDAANGFIYVGGAAAQNLGTRTLSAGDVITVEFDTQAGTVSFFRNGVKLGATVTGLGFASLFPFVGHEGPNAATATFGSGQAKALSQGYVPFDN